MIEDGDAARAFVAAAVQRLDEPVNIVAPARHHDAGDPARQAAPLPLFGPESAIAARLSHVVGVPIPDHVVELMHRGRLADGSKAQAVLGFEPRLSTPEVIDHLYAWESVVRIGSIHEAVA